MTAGEQVTVPPRPRRFRWLRGLAIGAVVLAGLGYLIAMAPDYIAQYVVRTYFQGIAVDTSGIETIDINPLRGDVRFGPVSFRGADGEVGKIGRIKVHFDIRRLFSRQALVQSAEVVGVRIDIRQAPDGAISINGIPLTRILADQAAQAEGAPAPKPDAQAIENAARAWGAGIDVLRLRDSRIVFTDPRGGEAAIDVRELDLDGFTTWAPDEPGRFRLDGALNRIDIAIAGTATPFADTLAVDATLAVTGIAFDKIEAYTGPLGLNPSDGRIDVRVETKGSTVSSDGLVDARLVGHASLSDFNLAQPDFGSLQLKSGAMSLDDIHLLYDATGMVTVDGNASLDLAAMALRLDDGTEVGFDAARVGLPALSVRLPPKGAPTLGLTPQLDVRALRLGGKYVEGGAETVTIRLSEFDVDTQAAAMPLTATGTLDAGGLALLLPLKKPIRIGAATLGLELDGMRFAFGPDATTIDGALGLDVADLGVAVTKRGDAPGSLLPLVEIAAATLQGRLATLALDDKPATTTPAPAPATTAVKVAGQSLRLEGFRLDAPVAPGSTLGIAAPKLDLRSTDIDVADGATLEVAGRSTLAAPTFAVEIGGSGARSSVTFTDFAVDPRRFAYRENGPLSDLTFQARIDSERLAVRLPSDDEGLATAVNLDRLRTAIGDFAMDIDNPDPQWHIRNLDLAFASLDAALPGALSALLDLKDLNLAGGVAASRGEYGVERLGIGHIDASLTRKPAAPGAPPAATPGADAAPSAANTDQPGARPWPPPDLPVVRIGQLALLDGGTITVNDRTVVPPATSRIDISRLSIENLDSTDPAARASLRLAAMLEQAALTADGWALPFKPKPDFDLRADVKDLRLPSVNPYVGPTIGLDIVNGTLTASAEARADAGQLDGEVRANLVNLGFADRANAGSDRISRSIGVPLSTIVALLQDADGSIALTLPFDGDLLSPTFDYSQMIWSGVFRVLRALLVAPFKLISASIDLAAARREGGEAAAPIPSGAAASPELPSIAFAPGAAAPGDDARGALATVRQVLQQRPKMRLRLCGVATPADGAAPALPAASASAPEAEKRARLLDLARQRMIAVQAALTADSGIAPSRLPLCAEPLIAGVESGPPRVELGF